MTVGAKKLQILESVVKSVAVDVMERHAERLSPPLGYAAPLAAVPLEAGGDQPPLDVTSIPPPPRYQ
jgi:hypothetical protein